MARTKGIIAPATALTSGAAAPKLLMAIYAPADQKVIVPRTKICGKGVTAGATPIELTCQVGVINTAGAGSTTLAPSKADPTDSTALRVTAKHSFSTEPTLTSPVQVMRAAFPPTLGHLSNDEVVIPAGQAALFYMNAGVAVDLVPEWRTEE